MRETLSPGDEPAPQGLKNEPSPAKTRGRKKRPFLIIFLFLIAIAGFGALAVDGVKKRSQATEELQKQVIRSSVLTVSVVSPEKAPATISIDLPGQTQAFTQAPVYAQTTGYVKKWNFDIGAHVKEGDILAEIDTPEVDQQLAQARAQLNVAQSALHLSEATYKRDEDLYRRNVISAQDFDIAADNYHGNQATLIADEANVKRLEALENFKVVKAPFDGIVTVRNIDIGGLVNAGSGNPLFIVAQIKPLRVYINVPQSLAPGINTGDAAELRLNEMPDEVFPGKVVRTAGAIDPNSRTLLTEVDVPNEDGKLLPGAYVQVHLMSGATGQTLLVPESSLLFRSEGPTLGVVSSDNRVQLKKIKIGRDLGTRLEIVQGLSPGDRVIVSPSDSLASGQLVKIQPTPNEKSR